MAKITTYLKEGMLFESHLGDHKILIEGPEDWGGKNTAPPPPQFFMASIGSCVGVLVTRFCDTHQLDPSGMTVRIIQRDSLISRSRLNYPMPNVMMSALAKPFRKLLNIARHMKPLRYLKISTLK